MSGLPGILASLFQSVNRLGDKFNREDWIRSHRLEPMLHGVEVPGLALSETFMAECRQAYMNMIGRAQLFRTESTRLVDVLTGRGIPCFVWRGVDYGQRYYGDMALRYFTDLDLMVPPAMRREALRIMQGAGYRLRSRFIPAWFLSRHHHHWPLISADGRFPLEVHWAVDNPYRDVGIDALVTGEQDDVTRIILACLHAEKESRLRHCMSVDEMSRQLLVEDPVLPWIDLAVMVQQAGPAVIKQLAVQTASEPLKSIIVRSMWIIQNYFGVSVPDFQLQEPVFLHSFRNRMHTRIRHIPLAQKIGRVLHCRPDVLLDWMDFLVPEQRNQGTGSRFVSIIGRAGKVLGLFLDGIVCGIWVLIQKIGNRFSGKPVAA